MENTVLQSCFPSLSTANFHEVTTPNRSVLSRTFANYAFWLCLSQIGIHRPWRKRYVQCQVGTKINLFLIHPTRSRHCLEGDNLFTESPQSWLVKCTSVCIRSTPKSVIYTWLPVSKTQDVFYFRPITCPWRSFMLSLEHCSLKERRVLVLQMLTQRAISSFIGRKKPSPTAQPRTLINLRYLTNGQKNPKTSILTVRSTCTNTRTLIDNYTKLCSL